MPGERGAKYFRFAAKDACTLLIKQCEAFMDLSLDMFLNYKQTKREIKLKEQPPESY